MKPGPARRPALQVIREGNPGHQPKMRLEASLHLPPEAPPEPDWQEWFPPVRGDRDRTAINRRARERARREWRSVVRTLDTQGLLATVDDALVTQHAVVVASIWVEQRHVAAHGSTMQGARGPVRNPSVTALNQLRTQLKFSIGQLGLSPAARAEFGITGAPDTGDPDGPFDV